MVSEISQSDDTSNSVSLVTLKAKVILSPIIIMWHWPSSKSDIIVNFKKKSVLLDFTMLVLNDKQPQKFQFHKAMSVTNFGLSKEIEGLISSYLKL